MRVRRNAPPRPCSGVVVKQILRRDSLDADQCGHMSIARDLGLSRHRPPRRFLEVRSTWIQDRASRAKEGVESVIRSKRDTGDGVERRIAPPLCATAPVTTG